MAYNALKYNDFEEDGFLNGAADGDDHHLGPGSGRSPHTVASSPVPPPSAQRSGSGMLQKQEGRQGSGGLRGWANFLRDKASQASSSVGQRDGSQEQQAVSTMRNKSGETARRLQSQASKGWKQARERTVEGYRKVTGGALAGMCRGEALAQPCPRAVLVCCSAIVCGGLATEGLFRRDVAADVDAVHWLLGGLCAGQGVVLPAAGASTHVIAAALMQWLQTLEEPLLTYKLLPDFVLAGREAPLRGTVVMKQLPVANFNCLQVLLETWHRLASHSAINGMDAHVIAENVVTSLAWHPPPPASKQQSYMTLASDNVPDSFDDSDDEKGSRSQADEAFGAIGPRTDLNPMEVQALTHVVERMIESFTHAVGNRDTGIYQGPVF